jgi:hypothetical protein
MRQGVLVPHMAIILQQCFEAPISPEKLPFTGSFAFCVIGPFWCTAPQFHTGAQLSNAEAVLQEALDWVQRSSVAADNNGICAEGIGQ